MNQDTKNTLLREVNDHIGETTISVSEEIIEIEQKLSTGNHEMGKLSYADEAVQQTLNLYNQRRLEELVALLPSPYFVRCEVDFPHKGKVVMYFAKFPFTKQSVYWWIAKAAAIRFENPGPFSYQKNDGTMQSGVLVRKDQYLIVEGKLVFFATESINEPRALVYQEHFTTRRNEFVLPEIVAQMEKAQDQVVRISYKGPFVITGPAGSGKTTLALHRIAFLVQSPETAEIFKGNSILVLVQDISTKEYFSHILPELGITDVIITTFSEWVQSILHLSNYTVVKEYDVGDEAVHYQEKKLAALRSGKIPEYDVVAIKSLDKVYQEFLGDEDGDLWNKQKKEQVLDRYDIALLCTAYQEKFGGLTKEESYIVPKKNGQFERKTKKFPMVYAGILVDEFQNYLPEELRIIRSCITKETNSMMYVGDIAQQIYLGTLRTWEEIDEQIPEERQVKLQKVYRNTKEILEYIAGLGYSVVIPEHGKRGDAVVEMAGTQKKQRETVDEVVSRHEGQQIAIIAKDTKDLASYKKQYTDKQNVHVMTMSQSQGVEFDVVCVVGIREDLFSIPSSLTQENYRQKQRINRDLLYVALSRAREKLYVVGDVKLSGINIG